MSREWVAAMAVLVLAGCDDMLNAPPAEDAGHVLVLPLSESQVAVVAHGEFEPASIGSYSVHVYRAESPNNPFDRFAGGVIAERDGVLEQLTTADLNGDGAPELIVICRSAGTGGYLNVDAYALGKPTPLLLRQAHGIAPDADSIQALRDVVE